MVGLSNGDSTAHYNDIDFGLGLATDNQIYIYEQGNYVGTFGGYALGDRLRVGLEGGVVTYRRNGTLLHASTRTPTYPLLVDTALNTPSATISGVFLTATAAAVAAPTLSPSVATSNANVSVQISCVTPGATIRYTLNGSDPTPSDPTIASGSRSGHRPEPNPQGTGVQGRIRGQLCRDRCLHPRHPLSLLHSRRVVLHRSPERHRQQLGGGRDDPLHHERAGADRSGYRHCLGKQHPRGHQPHAQAEGMEAGLDYERVDGRQLHLWRGYSHPHAFGRDVLLDAERDVFDHDAGSRPPIHHGRPRAHSLGPIRHVGHGRSIDDREGKGYEGGLDFQHGYRRVVRPDPGHRGHAHFQPSAGPTPAANP